MRAKFSRRGSLNYRTREKEIIAGRPPARYADLVRFVPGQRIVELGSAEGVLALMLAAEGKVVTAIERDANRHTDAVKLQLNWLRLGIPCGAVTFICRDAADQMFDGFDTVVAIRAIYHFDDVKKIFAAIAAAGVANIVLGGNAGRARAWKMLGEKNNDRNKYASEHGMIEILNEHGYMVTDIAALPDPLVVGLKP